ncbi:MAG: hypothetical protein U0Y08_13355 [Bacteroidia bacterium]
MPVPSARTSYVVVAEAYRLLLVNGFPVREQLVHWADLELLNNSEADIFLADLSTSSSMNLNDLISLLQRYVGYEKPLVSSRAVIGYLADNFAKGYLPLEKICDSLCRLERQGGLTHEEKSMIVGLDDEYSLAKDGIRGSVEEVVAYLQRLLEGYRDFRLEEPGSWQLVNSKADAEIRQLFQTVREERSAFIHEERNSRKRPWWRFW